MRIILLLLLMFSFHANADTTGVPVEVQSAYSTIIEATIENDLTKFRSVCNSEMSKAMKQGNLDKVSSSIVPAMKKGHDSIFLGKLNQGDYITYLWKIDFKDSQTSDILAKLSTKKNSSLVAGFYYDW